MLSLEKIRCFAVFKVLGSLECDRLIATLALSAAFVRLQCILSERLDPYRSCQTRLDPYMFVAASESCWNESMNQRFSNQVSSNGLPTGKGLADFAATSFHAFETGYGRRYCSLSPLCPSSETRTAVSQPVSSEKSMR